MAEQEEVKTESTLDNLAFGSALEAEDNTSFKVAWIAALVIHFALFLTVFPDFGETVAMEEERDAVVIKRYKPPEPPKEQPKKKVVKKKTARVPIPDPSPDEPEPIVERDVEYIETSEIDRADTEYTLGAPPSGPPVQDEGPLRVGGEIQAPERIDYVAPQYPELARRARLQGVVIIEAVIDRQGDVKDTQILRGLGLGLDEAARAAVQQWKYTPTFYNGRPVEILLTVTVQFELQ